MSSDIRPNLFIVGAPKCGTTSMYTYLGQHPEIYFSIAKEPHFFGSDLQYAPSALSEEKYLSYFSPGRHHKWRGEASVFYLYSTEAAREIRTFSPSAKIIIMLRDPVEMLYSLHSQYLFNEREDLVVFEDAIAAEYDRLNGRRIPPYCHFVKGLYYREVARYAPQVTRYLNTFGADSVRVVLYEDFRTRTAEVYREILEFLEVDPSITVDFSVVNPNKQHRSKLLRRFYGNPPRLLRTAARVMLPQRARYGVLSALRSLNSKMVSRTPLASDTRRYLVDDLADSITELSELLGRDLSHWSTV